MTIKLSKILSENEYSITEAEEQLGYSEQTNILDDLYYLGFIDENLKPHQTMLDKGYMGYNESEVWNGDELVDKYITPDFTVAGIEFIRNEFIKAGIIKNKEA